MMNRREALARLGGLMAMGWVGTNNTASAAVKPSISSTGSTGAAEASGKPFSIVHVTDIHLSPRRVSEEWVAKCFHQFQSDPSKPSLILNTGDTILDTSHADRAYSDEQWKLWRGTLQRENSLPIHHVLGNHDIWGVSLKPDDPIKKDPMYGKKLGQEGLGLEKLYYSFDYGDWHFIMLDSVQAGTASIGHKWYGKLDDEQFAWLENDLKATPANRPVIIGTHIPIIQMCVMNGLKPDDDLTYKIGPTQMMSDARKIVDLFKKHDNVKLCLSGHMHQLDRVELDGVTYICDGALSGAKWKGNTRGVPPGYSLISLKPDGTFDYKYHTYGWKLKTS